MTSLMNYSSFSCENSPPDCVVTVFFCGSDGNLLNPRTWLEFFFHACTGADLLSASAGTHAQLLEAGGGGERPAQFKMGFNGCGVDYGLLGILFGRGLEEQCETAVVRVRALLGRFQRLRVSLVGLSRGAVACLMLAKRLQQLESPQLLRADLFLFDPVPGNFITTAKIDRPFGCTLANTHWDLSCCPLVRRVVCLYPYQPLRAVMAHAPLVLRYPPSAAVLEDVLLGCHQGAFFIDPHLDSRISFRLLLEFLTLSRSALNLPAIRTQESWLGADEASVLRDIGEELQEPPSPSHRATHDPSYLRTGSIRRHSRASFLNKYHRRLLSQSSSSSSSSSTSSFSLPSSSTFETNGDDFNDDMMNHDDGDDDLPLISPSSNVTDPTYLLELTRADSVSGGYIFFLLLCIGGSVGIAATLTWLFAFNRSS